MVFLLWSPLSHSWFQTPPRVSPAGVHRVSTSYFASIPSRCCHGLKSTFPELESWCTHAIKTQLLIGPCISPAQRFLQTSMDSAAPSRASGTFPHPNISPHLDLRPCQPEPAFPRAVPERGVGRWLQLRGHPLLRILVLPRELWCQGTSVKWRWERRTLGKPLPFPSLSLLTQFMLSAVPPSPGF